MSAAHTRGPWVAECIGVTDAGPNGCDVYEVLTADGYRRICEGLTEQGARLIAAAPDLLAALERAIPEIATCCPGEVLEQARAALASAKEQTK